MITTLTTNTGLVYAYITWNVTNKQDQLDDKGEYVNVGGCWIHESYRGNGVMTKLIESIFDAEKQSNIAYIFYEREKGNKKSGIIPIYKFLKHTKYRKTIMEAQNGT